jgi:membrane protease YdiL (CAAX protease family)
MDAVMVERVFVDAHGRLHWPWRLAAFGFFAVAAFLVGQLVVYPVVSAALGATGVRFVAWPWISLFAIVVAHALVKRGVDPRVTWADLGLGEAAIAPSRLALGFAMGAAAILVPSVLLWAFGWFTFEPTGDGAWLTSSVSAAMVLLPAALFEELLVRGYAFGVLTERFGAAAALVASSAFFALMHLTNPGATAQSLATVAIAGVWLAAVRLATGSLWAAFAAHFAWNAAMALVLHARVSGFAFATPEYRMIDTGPAWATGGVWGPEGGAFAALGMMAATAALLARPAGRALFTRPDRRGEIRT